MNISLRHPLRVLHRLFGCFCLAAIFILVALMPCSVRADAATDAFNKGVDALKNQRNEEAFADYYEAIRLNPDYTDAYYNRGKAYYDIHDFDMAIADFSNAIRLNPNNVDTYIYRGCAYEGKGDHDKAIADYTEAIRLKPDSVVAYDNRGIAYKSKSDYELAIADFSEALRFNPNYALAYYNRGLACKHKGDYDKAIADFSDAIRLDPNDSNIYIYRDNAYHAKHVMNMRIVLDSLLIACCGYLAFIPFDKRHVRTRWAKSVFAICAAVGVANGAIWLAWDFGWFAPGSETSRQLDSLLHPFIYGLIIGLILSLILSGQLSGKKQQSTAGNQ